MCDNFIHFLFSNKYFFSLQIIKTTFNLIHAFGYTLKKQIKIRCTCYKNSILSESFTNTNPLILLCWFLKVVNWKINLLELSYYNNILSVIILFEEISIPVISAYFTLGNQKEPPSIRTNIFSTCIFF